MVIDYLKKTKKEYLDNKIALEKEINQLQILIKENIEFETLLEEANDSNYELFTPREVNVKNKARIQENKDERKKLEETLNSIMVEYNELEERLEKITVVLDTAVAEIENQNKEYNEEYNEESFNEPSLLSNSVIKRSLNSILHKIDLCSKFMDVDIVRSKMEMKIVYEELRKTINRINEV